MVRKPTYESLEQRIRKLEREIDQHTQREEALKKSEERLRLVLDATDEGLWDWNTATGEVYFSPGFFTMLGYSPNELPPRYETWANLLHPDDKEPAERIVREHMEGNIDSFEMEFRLKTKPGDWKWILGRGKIVERHDDGNPLRVIGTHRDISRRKKLEHELKLFQFVINQASFCCFWLDSDGRITYVNGQACRSLGYSREELLSMSVEDIDSGYPPDVWRDFWKRLQRTRVRTFTSFHQRKDGTRFPVGITANYVEFDGKEYSCAYVSDLSEQIRTEKALIENEDRLHQGIRVSNIGIFDHDHIANTIYWSPRQREIHGWGPEEPVTLQAFITLVHPEDLPWIEASVRRAHDPTSDGFWDVEHRIVRRDGSVRWLTARSQTFFDGAGAARRPVRTVGAVRDITEEKQSEARIKHLTRLYAFLSQVNQAIIRTRDREELFQAVCRVAIEFGGFRMAWIGLFDETAGVIKPITHSGHEIGFRQMIAGATDTSPAGPGLADTAFHKRAIVVCNDIATDRRMSPWRDDALQHGYLSAAAVPFQQKGTVIGILSLFAPERNFFAEEERNLLEEIGVDISHALDALNAEKALLESEERFRSIFEGAMDGIALADTSTRMFVMGNKTVRDMLGCTDDEMRTMKIDDIHPADALPVVLKHLENIASGEGSMVHGIPVRRTDGSIFFADINASVLNFGGKARIVGIFRDVTERKKALEEQRKLVSIIEESTDLIGIADLEGRLLYLNAAGQKLVGLDDTENGLHLSERRFQMMDGFHTFETEILPTLLQTGSWKGEIAYRHFKTGAPVPVEMNGFVIRDETTGQPIALANISHDLTERKRTEKEREQLQAQLAQVQKMESVGRLAGGVAHDFNNMLTVIIGHAELALKKLDPASPVRADLHQIKAAGLRSADLTNQLLAFARKQTVAPRVLDLNDTTEGMLKMLRRLIGEDIDMAWEPSHGLWPVKIDPAQIHQILANLLVNAREAIIGEGKVTIETGNVELDEAYCAEHLGFVPGKFAMLAVSDDGCGMDRETLSSIFEPFFTTKSQGTGLGLATVYGIVKQNEGFISVYSEPGKGTTFKIFLPRHAAGGVPDAKERPVQAAKGGTETILLVEDDPMVLQLNKTLLEERGYTVLPASAPGEAIRLAEEHSGRIQLLVTDVVMPGMNGRELSIRLIALLPDLKCLFMSGYTANAIAHRGVLEEGVHFLQKPVSGYSLAVKVREILDGELP